MHVDYEYRYVLWIKIVLIILSRWVRRHTLYVSQLNRLVNISYESQLNLRHSCELLFSGSNILQKCSLYLIAEMEQLSIDNLSQSSRLKPQCEHVFAHLEKFNLFNNFINHYD